jgi:hypothetical protein
MVPRYLKYNFKISESVAYEWGPKPGLVRYYYDIKKRPDTQVDALSLGFITPLQNAVLLRVDSATTNDYLELEIVIDFFYRSTQCFELLQSSLHAIIILPSFVFESMAINCN